MPLASTPDIAANGFGYLWATKAFVPTSTAEGAFSEIATGNTTIGSSKNEIAYGKFAIRGSNGYRQYPAHLNGSGSAIKGGSKMYDLEVTNDPIGVSQRNLSQLLSTDLSGATGAVQTTLFNLYTLQKPSISSETESNQLTLNNFLDYDYPSRFPSGDQGLQAIATSGKWVQNYKNDPWFGKTKAGKLWVPLGPFYYDGQPNELSFTRNINPQIIYTSDQGSLQIGDGNISSNIQDLSDGQNLNVAFAFIGTDGSGGGDQFNFNSSFTNSITSSHTQGTTNLTSEQQQNSDGRSDGGSNTEGGSQGGEISVSVSATEKASAGIGDDEVGLSATETAGFKHSWSSTWQNVSSFNATTERSLTSENSDSENENDTQGSDITNTFSFSANIDLSGAIETGKTPNGTPLYNYQTSVTDPTTGQTKIVTLDLVQGESYKWELSFYKGFVQQAVTGNYSITGEVGSLDDSSNNQIGGNVAQAYYNAQAGQGLEFANVNPALIHSFNTTPYSTDLTQSIKYSDVEDPGELRSVNINGSTTAGTAVNNNLVLKLVALSPYSSDSGSTSSSMVKAAATKKKSAVTIHDGLALQPHETSNPTGYNGSDDSEILNDSPGQDFIRMGGGHDRVSLSGNTVQEDNDGDIVYLGDGNDHLDAKNAEGRNSVFAGTGNDRVVDGKGDLGADLGDGNDTFVHGGGTDYVTLGEGRDKVRIRANARTTDDTLVVHDFHVGDDFITGLNKNARLQWDSTINGFKMQGHGSSTIRLHTWGQEQVMEPDFWVGLGLQNMYALKLKTGPSNILNWDYIRDQYGRYGFSKSSVNYDDWETFSTSDDNLKETVQSLATLEGKGNLSAAQLDQISGFAQIVDSFHAFVAGTYDILNL